MFNDIYQQNESKNMMVFIISKGGNHNDSLLWFKLSLCTTLRIGGSIECKEGWLMDGVTIECTIVLIVFCNVDKCITYNVWSPFKPNIQCLDSHVTMKIAPTSQKCSCF